MPPGMYGYMRLAAGSEASSENEVLKAELKGHAEREGFTLEQMFTEQVQADEPAFDRLMEALRAGAVRDVIVPSLWHFARLPNLQKAMREHVEREIGARLWIVQGVRP
jgi:hypothetical protein